jgi:membrane fusion protein (multidrug efflux system)
MFARPRVVFAVREAAVMVPEEALVPLGAQQLIFKVAEGAGGKKVAQRLVARIGLRLPGKVEILEGLKAGDTVVTAGHTRLLRGDDVALRVVDISRSDGGAAGTSGPPATAPASGAGNGVGVGTGGSARPGPAPT